MKGHKNARSLRSLAADSAEVVERFPSEACPAWWSGCRKVSARAAAGGREAEESSPVRFAAHFSCPWDGEARNEPEKGIYFRAFVNLKAAGS